MAVLATFLLSLLLLIASQAGSGGAFSFALIGDQEYDSEQEARFPNLIEDINQDRSLSFVVHVGDIKSGATPCSDDLFYRRLNEFNSSQHPLIYVFGDNEWTDCHRPAAGGYDPLERLAQLRRVFAPFERKQSLGRVTRELERQSPEFPENVRWKKDGVMFVGLNVPGSNNGLATGKGLENQAQDEFQRRNFANIQWLKDAFGLAKSRRAGGVLVAIQANPWDYIPSNQLTGYQDFLAVLESETVAFGKPVVLAHGDSHYFRIDKPLPTAPFNPTAPFQPPLWESKEPRLENFTRVEAFGTVNAHWIKVTVDPDSAAVFRFEERIVETHRPARGSSEISKDESDR
jgi:hypothetical protein